MHKSHDGQLSVKLVYVQKGQSVGPQGKLLKQMNEHEPEES